MEKYEVSKEWISKNGKLIKNAYNVVLAGKYDITSIKDIFMVIKVVDPVNASEDNADILSKLLQLFSQQLDERLKPTQKVKERVIN